AQDLVQRKGVFAGLEDSAPPSLEPVARRPFAFDLEAGAAVSEQKETRGARNEMCASPPDRLARLCGEIKGDRILQSLGPAYDRTEARGPEEIIAYTMSARRTRFAGEVGLRIEKVDDGRARRVVNIKRPRIEELVQVPGTAHLHRSHLRSHQSLNLCRRNSIKYPF